MKHFHVKRPGQWWWAVTLTREQILDRWLEGRLEDDWLVHPLGKKHLKATLREFRLDGEVHRKLFLRLLTRQSQWKKTLASVHPQATLIGVYLWVLGFFVGLFSLILSQNLEQTELAAWAFIPLLAGPVVALPGVILVIVGAVQRRVRAYRIWRRIVDEQVTM